MGGGTWHKFLNFSTLFRWTDHLEVRVEVPSKMSGGSHLIADSTLLEFVEIWHVEANACSGKRPKTAGDFLASGISTFLRFLTAQWEMPTFSSPHSVGC